MICTTAEITMTKLLTDIMEVGDKVLEVAVNVANTVAGNPLLLMTVGFLFIGGCVGIFGRLLSRN